MGKWTNQGFQANTLQYYKEQFQKLFVSAFGQQFKLDDELPQGVLITRLSELAYNADMDGVAVTANLNPNTRSGLWLDYIGQTRGIPRGLGAPQMAGITITSNAAMLPYAIPDGTSFFAGNDQFTTVGQQTISEQGQGIVVYYVDSGNSSAEIGDTMTCSINAVTNVEITTLSDGQDSESDADYRTRLNNTYNVASSTMDWVESQIAAYQYTKTTGYEYNDTDQTVNSRPPHTSEWMAVPKPGVNQDAFAEAICEIIVNNKVPSSQTYGNTTKTVQDMFGREKEVSFTIPGAVPVEIDIQIATPETTGILDLTNVPTEKTNIAEYINGLTIGKDVPMSRVLAFVVSDAGYEVLGYKIRKVGTSDWVENANFVIGDREYATCEVGNITIGV